MTVLSDKEIRDRIQKGKLIIRGDSKRARECSYHFSAGKIFCAGNDGKIIDWTTPDKDAHYLIGPRDLFWIRTPEIVEVPKSICGFWWQTNSLSRKGVMLINMSMVEPGYRGPLACLFVNFGKERVRIDPSTIMAKLVFHRIGRNVIAPQTLNLDYAEYDSTLHDLALKSPSTFLSVSELAIELKEQHEDAIKAIHADTEELRKKFINDLKEDAPKAARKTLGWPAAGFVGLLVLLGFIPWLQALISPNIEEQIKTSVEKAIITKLVVSPTQLRPPHPTGVDWEQNIENRLKKIEERISKNK